MARDTIELMGKIEDTFNIALPEAIAENVRTVGDVHEIVWNSVNKTTANKCLTEIMFYKLRQSLHVTLGVPKSSITQETRLDDIIPFKDRRKIWKDIAAELQLKFPKLVLAPNHERTLIWFGVFSILAWILLSPLLYLVFDVSARIFLVPVVGAVLTMLLSLSLEPLRTAFPEVNLRNLTAHLQLLNHNNFKSTHLERHDLEVLINYIISDEVGVPLEFLGKDRKLMTDLNAN